jgi:MFS family permease
VLAAGLICAMIRTAGFLATTDIALLLAARVLSGPAAGLVTGTTTASLAELQPHGDRQAAAVVASGNNMTGLGIGTPLAGVLAQYVASPTRKTRSTGLCRQFGSQNVDRLDVGR